MSPTPERANRLHSGGSNSADLNTSDTLLLGAVFTLAAGSLILWAGAAASAVLSGHPAPRADLGAGLLALTRHGDDPSAAWGQPVGPGWLYWTATATLLAILLTVAAAGWWALARQRLARADDPRRLDGLASRAEVAAVAGAKALTARAKDLRPSLACPKVADLGHRLGSSRGVDC